jgi:hypothetical protein
MEGRGLAWLWGGAGGVAVLTEQWKPDPAVSDAADECFAAYGQVSRRMNRWTLRGIRRRFRLGSDGRWYPYELVGNRWIPAEPPAPDPETAARSLIG